MIKLLNSKDLKRSKVNRKQRRKAERDAGLLKKNSKKSFKDRQEIYKRKRKMGRIIHQQNLERIYNSYQTKQNEAYTKRLNELIDEGFTEDEAHQIIMRDDNQ